MCIGCSRSEVGPETLHSKKFFCGRWCLAAGLQITLYVAEESQDVGVQRAPSCEAFVSNTNTLWFILVCTSILHLSGLHFS